MMIDIVGWLWLGEAKSLGELVGSLSPKEKHDLSTGNILAENIVFSR